MGESKVTSGGASRRRLKTPPSRKRTPSGRTSVKSPGGGPSSCSADAVGSAEHTPPGSTTGRGDTTSKPGSPSKPEGGDVEFGGWPGVLALMVWSHVMPFYMYISLRYHGGALFYPSVESIVHSGGVSSSFAEGILSWVKSEFFDKAFEIASPFPGALSEACLLYGAFFVGEFVSSFFLPGVVVRGLPLEVGDQGSAESGARAKSGAAKSTTRSYRAPGSPPSRRTRLSYVCNAYAGWVATLVLFAGLHYADVFSLSRVAALKGPLMFVAMVTADVMAVVVYVLAFFLKKQCRMSGNVIYDFFMGAWLNPRIGSLDLKMWAMIKMSWVTLFLLTLSAAVEQFEKLGSVSNGMIVIVVAQFLYANACMKGEECVPTTWDIFHEKWGWMLIFWNFCGVPFVYTYQAFFIAEATTPSTAWTDHGRAAVAAVGAAGAADHHYAEDRLPGWAAGILLLVYAAMYYVWDVSQQQKNSYRLLQKGEYVRRPWAFPQLPNGVLHGGRWQDCKVLECGSRGEPCSDGSGRLAPPRTLLLDGFWGRARKIHYSTDMVMAAIWSLSTIGCATRQAGSSAAAGWGSFLPWVGSYHALCFFYPLFFTGMLMHRWQRDEKECEKKYGAYWEEYKRRVPYVFIPGVI